MVLLKRDRPHVDIYMQLHSRQGCLRGSIHIAIAYEGRRLFGATCVLPVEFFTPAAAAVVLGMQRYA